MKIDSFLSTRRAASLWGGSMLLAIAVSPLVIAQNEPSEAPHWWTPSTEGTNEHGKFPELLNRRKVYVNATFTDSRTIPAPSPTSRGDVQRMVMQAIADHKGLQVVANPAQADFAVVVRATAATATEERPPNFSQTLDPSTQVSVEVVVLVPGARRTDGTFTPRIVWESTNGNAQIEAQAAARFTVDGFLWELGKLKEKGK